MNDVSSADRTDTEAEIMDATYRALREHGAADLTIQSIADEFDKSKSLLYYHYEGKDDLLLSFLDFALDRFSTRARVDSATDPDERLETLLDHLLPSSVDAEDRQFEIALFELRARAPFEEEYRSQFTRADRLVRETLADVIREGVERGTFREADPDETAAHLLLLVNGSMVERVTTDAEDAAARARRAADRFLDERLRRSAE